MCAGVELQNNTYESSLFPFLARLLFYFYFFLTDVIYVSGLMNGFHDGGMGCLSSIFVSAFVKMFIFTIKMLNATEFDVLCRYSASETKSLNGSFNE